MRRPRQQEQKPLEIEGAICMHTLRPLPVGGIVERGQVLPVDHDLVGKYPDHFRALLRIEDIEEVRRG